MLSHHGLIERIHQLIGCGYLSELKEPQYRQKIARIAERVELSDYSLDEWAYAVSYIFSEEVRFCSDSERINYLISRANETDLNVNPFQLSQ